MSTSADSAFETNKQFFASFLFETDIPGPIFCFLKSIWSFLSFCYSFLIQGLFKFMQYYPISVIRMMHLTSHFKKLANKTTFYYVLRISHMIFVLLYQDFLTKIYWCSSLMSLSIDIFIYNRAHNMAISVQIEPETLP